MHQPEGGYRPGVAISVMQPFSQDVSIVHAHQAVIPSKPASWKLWHARIAPHIHRSSECQPARTCVSAVQLSPAVGCMQDDLRADHFLWQLYHIDKDLNKAQEEVHKQQAAFAEVPLLCCIFHPSPVICRDKLLSVELQETAHLESHYAASTVQSHVKRVPFG